MKLMLIVVLVLFPSLAWAHGVHYNLSGTEWFLHAFLHWLELDYIVLSVVLVWCVINRSKHSHEAANSTN